MLLNLVHYKTISQSFISFLCGLTAGVFSCLPFHVLPLLYLISVIYIFAGENI